MKAKKISEALGDLLQPRTIDQVIKSISHLSVEKQIAELEKMQSKWGDLYKDLLNDPKIIQELKDNVKSELDKKSIIEKVNHIESLEHKLPNLFSDFRDKETIEELKKYILKQPLSQKSKLVYRFFKSWPSLFDDIADDNSIDQETNQLLLLFKIKAAIDRNEIGKIQEFVKTLGDKYGRETILDKAEDLIIPGGGYDRDYSLFNKKDLEQLKLTLYKETRSEEEEELDDQFNIYAFIPYDDYKNVEIDGESYHKKRIGIENLVKIDKYDSASLAQVNMMKIRANHQYGTPKVYGVYIPKFMWDRDYAGNEEIPDKLRKFIDENKFSF